MSFDKIIFVSLLLLSAGILIRVFIFVPYLNAIKNNRASDKLFAEEQEKHRLSRCALCLNTKTENLELVRGESGSVCSTCLLDSIVLLDEDSDSKNTYFYKLIVRKLCSIEKLEFNNNLFDFVSKQSKLDVELKNEIVMGAAKSINPHYVVKVLKQTPENKWTKNDVLNWIWANCQYGDFEMALKYPDPDKMEKVEFESMFQRHLQINRVAALVKTDTSTESIDTCLSTMLEIKEELERDDYPLAPEGHTVLSNVHGNIAYCLYLQNDFNGCLENIDLIYAMDKASGYADLLAGNAHEKLNNDSEAIRYWKRGLEDLEAGEYIRNCLNEKLHNLKS